MGSSTRADLYALGMIVFERLAGKSPIKGDLVAVISYKLSEELPSVATFAAISTGGGGLGQPHGARRRRRSVSPVPPRRGPRSPLCYSCLPGISECGSERIGLDVLRRHRLAEDNANAAPEAAERVAQRGTVAAGEEAAPQALQRQRNDGDGGAVDNLLNAVLERADLAV